MNRIGQMKQLTEKEKLPQVPPQTPSCSGSERNTSPQYRPLLTYHYDREGPSFPKLFRYDAASERLDPIPAGELPEGVNAQYIHQNIAGLLSPDKRGEFYFEIGQRAELPIVVEMLSRDNRKIRLLCEEYRVAVESAANGKCQYGEIEEFSVDLTIKKTIVRPFAFAVYKDVRSLVTGLRDDWLVSNEKRWVSRISKGADQLRQGDLSSEGLARVDRITTLISEHREALANELTPLIKEMLLESPPPDLEGKRRIAHYVNELLRTNSFGIAHPEIGLACSVLAKYAPRKPEGWFCLGLRDRACADQCKVAYPSISSNDNITLIEASREERLRDHGKK